MATINLGAIKFNWKGAYNNGTAYTVDDVVSSGGSSYVCIQASTGNAVSNGSYWQVMAQGGDVATTLSTQGDILYRDGSGLQRLAKGTAAQELRMNSGATAPEWYTPTSTTGKTIQMQHTRHTGMVSWTHPTVGTANEITTANRVTITPTSTSNHLILDLFMPVSGGGTTALFNFMFYDVTGSAVFNPSTETIGSRGATWGRGIMGHRGPHADANDLTVIHLRQIGLAPRASSTTFAVYARGQGNTAFYINHDNANNNEWGFTGQTLFTITEMDLS